MCQGRGGRGYRDYEDECFDRDRDRDRGRGARDYDFRRDEPRRPPVERDDECDCDCDDDPGSPFGFKRQFISKGEVIETLEEYLSELLKEAEGVREAIDALKAEQAASKAKGPTKKEEKDESGE